ncbi:MAG: helix-turn-helix domain-containing protein [Trichocoleus desertorum ATA4-8-CV12]|jgi:transposase|nr:helix-turn-helix domain-containing protein [Trichocoleus desertorum ATA4-8-CV12]
MVEKQKLQELVNLGLSSRQIAERVGKSQTTIRYWIAKYQLALSPLKEEGKNC